MYKEDTCRKNMYAHALLLSIGVTPYSTGYAYTQHFVVPVGDK